MDGPHAPEKIRLTRDDWIAAGFRALLAEGPGGIRVEAIAREIGTTKGSFYWHFKDVPDLRAAMLALWEAEAVAVSALEPDLPARRRVMALVDLVSAAAGEAGAPVAAEPAIRDWARGDAEARGAVARLDAARIADLRGFLTEAGLGAAAAARGAVTLSAAIIGFAALRGTAGTDMRRDLAALARAVLDGRL
ncbi:MAG: TetR/AcrR family transcriptional regulator [Gemmobacter sp.]